MDKEKCRERAQRDKQVQTETLSCRPTVTGHFGYVPTPELTIFILGDERTTRTRTGTNCNAGQVVTGKEVGGGMGRGSWEKMGLFCGR